MKLYLVLAAAIAGATPALADDASCATLRLSDPGWTDITSTNALASAVLTGLGYTPTVKTLSVPIGYEAMKKGDIDVFLGNWMPAQQHFRDDLDASGAAEVIVRNLTGAKFTLAVPTAAAPNSASPVSRISRRMAVPSTRRSMASRPARRRTRACRR